MKHALVVVAVLTLASIAQAQEGYEHLSPVSHGGGRTYVVTSRGLDAVGLNPALLALKPRRPWEISIIPATALGAQAGAAFLSDKLTDFANNTADLDSGKHGSAVDLLSGDRLSGRGDARILGAYYHNDNLGGLAVTWTTHGGLQTRLPDQLLEFLKNYMSFISKSLELTQVDAQALWYSAIGASYGRNLTGDPEGFIKNLSIGGSIKYIQGLGYIRLEEGAYFKSRPLSLQRLELQANYSLRYSFIDVLDRAHNTDPIDVWDVFSGAAGSGLGFDVGAAAAIGGTAEQPALTLGASITDIGFISWGENTIERKADHVIDTIYYQTAATVDQTVTDTLAFLAGDVRRVSGFTTNLPTTLRVGAALNLRRIGLIKSGPEFTLATEITQGLSDVIGSLQDTRVGLGLLMEIPAVIMSFRAAAGLVLEGSEFDVSLGLGTSIYDYVSIDIASAQLGRLFGKEGENSADLALGLKVNF